jgi:hypothetical protein
MKLRTIVVPCLLTLSGCMTFNHTGVLVTPVGVAGIHSFAPSQTPDSMRTTEVRKPLPAVPSARTAPATDAE